MEYPLPCQESDLGICGSTMFAGVDPTRTNTNNQQFEQPASTQCSSRYILPQCSPTTETTTTDTTRPLDVCPLCIGSDHLHIAAGCTDFSCYCYQCEPESTPVVSHPTAQTPQAVLSTGWPISIDTPASLDLTAIECLRIYDVVRSTGVPNFLQARIPIPHSLHIGAWHHYLAGHSDLTLVDFLQYGWPVGFNPDWPVAASNANHASADNFPSHVQAYLDKEVSAQAMLGPFSEPHSGPGVTPAP